MGSVFALFLAGYLMLVTKHRAGFYLMLFCLSLEFFFYLWNIVGNGLRQGYGWFSHLREPDHILWTVFAIGYLSFFASGYFLMLLLARRKSIA